MDHEIKWTYTIYWKIHKTNRVMKHHDDDDSLTDDDSRNTKFLNQIFQ